RALVAVAERRRGVEAGLAADTNFLEALDHARDHRAFLQRKVHRRLRTIKDLAVDQRADVVETDDLAELRWRPRRRGENLVAEAAGQLHDVLVFLQLREEFLAVLELLEAELGHERLVLFAEELLQLGTDILG